MVQVIIKSNMPKHLAKDQAFRAGQIKSVPYYKTPNKTQNIDLHKLANHLTVGCEHKLGEARESGDTLTCVFYTWR